VGEDSSEPCCWLALGQVYTCTANMQHTACLQTQCEQRGTALMGHERSQQPAMLAASRAGGWRWARCTPAQQHVGEAVRYYTDASCVQPAGRAVLLIGARPGVHLHSSMQHTDILYCLVWPCVKPAASNASSKPWVLGQGYTLYSNTQHTASFESGEVRC
jgi:hypothetical protein